MEEREDIDGWSKRDGGTRKSKVILKVETAEKGGEPNTSTVAYSDQDGNCVRKVDPILEFLAGGGLKEVLVRVPDVYSRACQKQNKGYSKKSSKPTE